MPAPPSASPAATPPDRPAARIRLLAEGVARAPGPFVRRIQRSGDSSLGLPHALPADAVTIDRTFASDLKHSASARAVVRADAFRMLSAPAWGGDAVPLPA